MLVHLKMALLRRRISQAKLARAIGVTPSYFSRMMCGHVRLRARYQREIAKFLAIRQSKLFPTPQIKVDENKHDPEEVRPTCRKGEFGRVLP
jgi:transcriptional regulator with XRE-family HTH domain